MQGHIPPQIAQSHDAAGPLPVEQLSQQARHGEAEAGVGEKVGSCSEALLVSLGWGGVVYDLSLSEVVTLPLFYLLPLLLVSRHK